MYRLRFFDLELQQYGVLYFSDTSCNVKQKFLQLYGNRFVVKSCASYRKIKNFLI